MKKNEMTKEMLLLVVAVIPFIYLAVVWGDLPDKIPMHWNWKGEIDRWGDKSELLFLECVLIIPTYLLLLFLPKFAAKKENIEMMGGKFYKMRLVMQLLMTAISMIILMTTTGAITTDINILMGACLAFFMLIFGNYMTSIRPNYFMGIRTPWTLDNEEVWKQTHLIGGRAWVVGGVLALLSLLVVPTSWVLFITLALMLLPMFLVAAYSYFLHKKLQ